MVQRIPHYSTVSLSTGTTLTANAYSCATFLGGVIFIRATGAITLDGTINASGLGFPGGAGGNSLSVGFQGTNHNSCTSNALTVQSNGGGGGGDSNPVPTYNGGGGGGGAYGTNGDQGGSGSSMPGGAGGVAYGNANLSTLLMGGGGGGGGGINGALGGAGGTGGGIIVLNADSITRNATGYVRAHGNVGSNGSGGGGGGGGGGAIRLNASTISGTNGIFASSVAGGTGGGGISGSGGLGGVGRIRCDNSAGNCSGTSPANNAGTLSTPTNTNVILRRTLVAPLDLSLYGHISIWIKSSVTGANILQFGIGETAATENTWNVTVNAADTWEEKVFDISGIATTARDAIGYTHLKYLGTGNVILRMNAFTYYE